MSPQFVPRDPAMHRLARGGFGHPDYCANCGRPYADHVHGECPEIRRTRTIGAGHPEQPPEEVPDWRDEYDD